MSQEDFDYDESNQSEYDDDANADDTDTKPTADSDGEYGSFGENIDDELEESDDDEDVDGTEEMGGELGNGDTLASDEEYDDLDDIGNEYVDYQKNLSKELIDTYHHESKIHNYTEVSAMSCVRRDNHGVITDEFHQTIPILSKFEKARVIGMRIKQLNAGADAFVEVPVNIINTRVIAEMELSQKKIPFIIRRPLPNGSSEYWKVSDLVVN